MIPSTYNTLRIIDSLTRFPSGSESLYFLQRYNNPYAHLTNWIAASNHIRKLGNCGLTEKTIGYIVSYMSN